MVLSGEYVVVVVVVLFHLAGFRFVYIDKNRHSKSPELLSSLQHITKQASKTQARTPLI